jgi:S-DNA-T family DNA segregation ATPase FtsK/SpoIIIE
MARAARRTPSELAWDAVRAGWTLPAAARFRGGMLTAGGLCLMLVIATYNAADPSWNVAAPAAPQNALGPSGAVIADAVMQSLGLGAWAAALLMAVFGLTRVAQRDPAVARADTRRRALTGALGLMALTALFAAPSPPVTWPLASGLGGFWGDALLGALASVFDFARIPGGRLIAAILFGAAAFAALSYALGLGRIDATASTEWLKAALRRGVRPALAPAPSQKVRRERRALAEAPVESPGPSPKMAAPMMSAPVKVRQPRNLKPSEREQREKQKTFDFVNPHGFAMPELSMLAKPKPRSSSVDESSLRQNAQLLESVLAEYGVRGSIDQIRPGPVVTLYELVPVAGVKHARVVALSDDIARSMGVAACRIAVVSGRNAIGIELPNARRETVYLRDLLSAPDYEKSAGLPLALGETIGGEPYVADLSKMPHLLIAGTTGSGKSVGVNAMILSILYRLSPEECRFIMIDPKMLELSVYDGIPHLLAPVVTDPKKAIVALKWTVREMEDRYRKMSKIGVRNVAGYNERAREAAARGEHFERTVQTGFDDAGRPVYESEKLRPEPMPYLVVVIDEVADLMLVAGKDIEGAVQRLAQMARAAGIHLIMATQRPSVDVITGTIKANFPTRISFQVTSKIDARTILGEQGAEQLLGQGDMLYMAGGGRVTRLHGPFVSDGEVEAVAGFLRAQGQPNYLDAVTASEDEESLEGEGGGSGGDGEGDLYDQAVAVVTRDRKASTSYIQRRLQIGYNRAASLMERMEQQGVVGAANHAGKREILAGPPPLP